MTHLIKDWADRVATMRSSPKLPSLTHGSTGTSSKLSRVETNDNLRSAGLPDEDEMSCAERDMAVQSPPKGKKRVTNSVSNMCSSICHIIT